MASFADYIALTYTVVLTPLYVGFTAKLGYKIYIKKTPDVRNEYYPIIFYKGVIDNITNIVQLFTGRILKFHILEDVYLAINFPVYILYFTTCTTYCIMYQITFLIAFNRYIAMLKPTRYKEIFELRKLHLYIGITLIPGLISGIVGVCFNLKYTWFPTLGRVMGIYTESGIEYFHASYGVFLNIPLIAVTTWMNLKCFFKNKKVLSTKNLRSSADSKLFLYNIISFITMWGFEFYYICRYFPYILGRFKNLESLAIQIVPWFLDVMTYGLWIFSIALSSVLRSLIPCCVKKKKQIKVGNSQSVNKQVVSKKSTTI
uniref:7TM_GPCR_Srx domain-containing protein n=1 Tax=Parastrongyloides trichosuri TaxID=131310 RepID=A0A0N4ZYW1_PARTI